LELEQRAKAWGLAESRGISNQKSNSTMVEEKEGDRKALLKGRYREFRSGVKRKAD